MPDAPICPVMSRPDAVDDRFHVVYCFGSKCAAWIDRRELSTETGDYEKTGSGSCGMMPRAPNDFPDPAKPEPDFPPNREIKDGDA